MSGLRQFDLNLLIQFEALITEAHVSRAAEKVFLSQSAMSHALNRLREHLNDPLLVRTQNGLQPTKRALQLLPKVRETLLNIERFLAPPEMFDPAKSDRSFKLACTDFFEAVTLPKLLEYLQQVAPQITIEVEMIGEHASQDKLESGAVDIVVGMDRSQPIPAGLINEVWQVQDFACLISVNQMTPTNTMTLKQYVAKNHVVYSDLTEVTSSIIDDWLALKNLSRNHIARTMDYIAAASIVAKTDSIMTLPKEMAQLFSEMLPVRVLAPPKSFPKLEMGIITHPLFDQESDIVWLKQILKGFV
jgi:DNA-binding transcriptional LysR family regulator